MPRRSIEAGPGRMKNLLRRLAPAAAVAAAAPTFLAASCADSDPSAEPTQVEQTAKAVQALLDEGFDPPIKLPDKISLKGSWQISPFIMPDGLGNWFVEYADGSENGNGQIKRAKVSADFKTVIDDPTVVPGAEDNVNHSNDKLKTYGSKAYFYQDLDLFSCNRNGIALINCNKVPGNLNGTQTPFSNGMTVISGMDFDPDKDTLYATSEIDSIDLHKPFRSISGGDWEEITSCTDPNGSIAVNFVTPKHFIFQRKTPNGRKIYVRTFDGVDCTDKLGEEQLIDKDTGVISKIGSNQGGASFVQGNGFTGISFASDEGNLPLDYDLYVAKQKEAPQADASADANVDAQADAGDGAPPPADASGDAQPDVGDSAPPVDSGSADAPEDAPEDAPVDAPGDAPSDAPQDAPSDAPEDAKNDADPPKDAPDDAPKDAPGDAPIDAPIDAESEGGAKDGGADADAGKPEDTESPTFKIIKGVEPNPTGDPTPSIVVKLKDNMSEMVKLAFTGGCEPDKKQYPTGDNVVVTFKPMPDGTWICEGAAQDEAGNWSTTESVDKFEVDTSECLTYSATPNESFGMTACTKTSLDFDLLGKGVITIEDNAHNVMDVLKGIKNMPDPTLHYEQAAGPGLQPIDVVNGPVTYTLLHAQQKDKKPAEYSYGILLGVEGTISENEISTDPAINPKLADGIVDFATVGTRDDGDPATHGLRRMYETDQYAEIDYVREHGLTKATPESFETENGDGPGGLGEGDRVYVPMNGDGKPTLSKPKNFPTEQPKDPGNDPDCGCNMPGQENTPEGLVLFTAAAIAAACRRRKNNDLDLQ